jgi:hypothetical protein
MAKEGNNPMRGLERRIRKLETVLPPLLTPDVSRMFGMLWFAVAYYLGEPSPDEKPFAAFARALGYANQSELESAMEDCRRYISDQLYSIFKSNQHDPDPLAKDRIRTRFGTVDPYRDLSIRLYRAEERVCTRFGIPTPSLEYSDAERFSEALKRMEAGLPQSYRDQLKMVLRRVDNLALMRVHSDDVAPYIRCFA